MAPGAGPDGRVRYFAYGSNLHRPQMAALAPTAVVEAPARLAGWELFVTDDGVLSIRPAGPSHEVLGLVWRCTPGELAVLDRFEAVDEGLYVRAVVSVALATDDGPGPVPVPVEALVYTAVSDRAGPPRPGYLEASVLPPMRALGFPAPYLERVEGWLAAGTAGPRWQPAPEPGAVFTTPTPEDPAG